MRPLLPFYNSANSAGGDGTDGAGVGIGSGAEDAPPPPPHAVKTSIDKIVISFFSDITLMLEKALHL